jgi:hypothetical protein
MIMFGFGLLTLSALLFEIDLYEGLENAIAAGIGAFSLLLLALSITAYRKTGQTNTIWDHYFCSLCNPTIPRLYSKYFS